jgi:hypothetical protein
VTGNEGGTDDWEDYEPQDELKLYSHVATIEWMSLQNFRNNGRELLICLSVCLSGLSSSTYLSVCLSGLSGSASAGPIVERVG